MSILKAFVNHLIEFTADMQRVFPQDAELRTTKIFLEGLSKVNPRSVIAGWKEYVNDPYEEKILKGDIGYFVNKDYTNDCQDTADPSQLLSSIESIRHKIKGMSEANKAKSMKYVQNLTKLCRMYFSK